LHEIIKQKSKDSSWAREIMNRAGIKELSTELCREKDGSADDILKYTIEWAFFTRSQRGQYDTALIELEVTWDKNEVGSPLPVIIDEDIVVKKPIVTVDDVHNAMKHYCDLIPFERIISITQWISTEINLKLPSKQEMAEALKKRNVAGPEERDIYASYIFECFLSEVEKRHEKAVIHIAIGAEPLPYETGSKLRTDTIFEFAEIVNRHNTIDFHVLLASAHQNQAFCTMARETPNLYLMGYWWHNFFPSFISRVIEERLDMLPLNKQIGFFTDAYCLDWAYGKSIIIRKQLAEVLEKKVEQGQYDYEQAIGIAKTLLFDSAADSFGMR